MKKRIILVLETETEDSVMIRDDFIKDDLKTEINCASNYYEIVSFETEELMQNTKDSEREDM